MGKSIEKVREEYEGKPYSRELGAEISREGYGFGTSPKTGTIVMIYKPLSPKNGH
jgi:hypothetical protein